MINLLPPEQLRKIQVIGLSKKALLLVILLVFVNLGVLGYQGYLWLNLKNQLEEVKKQPFEGDVEGKVKNLTQFEQEVEENYAFIEKAKAINKEEENRIWWSKVLGELASLASGGVRFEKFEVSEKDPKEIRITGVANTREEIISLESQLKRSGFYKEVVAPVSNLTSKDNVNFEFTLKLKDEWKN